MQFSKNHGKRSHAAMKENDPRSEPLKHHLEYLLNLGEVRATRVVATLVDGVRGQTNREDTVEMVYLPISMGYRNCYKRYMSSLGFEVRCKPNGAVYVKGVNEGKPVDHGFVSLSKYYNMWKRDYPQLKVVRPSEDICQYCFVFANRHRYLANHAARASTSVPEIDEDVHDEWDCNVDEEITQMDMLSIDEPESAATKAEEAREQLLLQSANHIRMARSQRALYPSHVAATVRNVTEGQLMLVMIIF